MGAFGRLIAVFSGASNFLSHAISDWSHAQGLERPRSRSGGGSTCLEARMESSDISQEWLHVEIYKKLFIS